MSTVSPRSRRSILRAGGRRSAIGDRNDLQAEFLRPSSSSCGRRAIEPSSFMISISAPAGCSPASRARSTAASVCPGRRSTPFWRARSGLMCPGRPRSEGRVAGSASARMVAARSWIETPVVQPFAQQIDRHGEGRAQQRSVVLLHHVEFQLARTAPLKAGRRARRVRS